MGLLEKAQEAGRFPNTATRRATTPTPLYDDKCCLSAVALHAAVTQFVDLVSRD